MNYIYFLKGLPASGKSTWAKSEVVKDQGKTIRINKDDLREMMFSSKWSKEREKRILSVRNAITEEALKDGKNVIWDDTNFSKSHFNKAKEISHQCSTEVQVKVIEFDTPLVECLERNKDRKNPVPERVIWDMYYKYVLPKKVENNIYNTNLPNAIMCDIDGTLALHQERNPFEYYKCLTDKVNTPVKKLLQEFSENYKIIMVTGREDVQYLETEQEYSSVLEYTEAWLEQNEILYDEIFIREFGDHRPDYVTKKEIYENYIKDRYNILFVVDDRLQVINMWRELGLTCFDVAGHNF